MRILLGFAVLSLIAAALAPALSHIPFGVDRMDVARYYLSHGAADTGAANLVTSVVLNYRALDTLGEVTVLFLASLGVGAFLALRRHGPSGHPRLPEAILIVRRGSQFLFPFILIFGAYIFMHGHLTPGGGFQGGAVIASAFLLMFLGHSDYFLREKAASATESLAGLVFVIVGLVGIAAGGYFLNNFLPKGTLLSLFSAGVIPVLYVAIGFKVGAELAGIVANMLGPRGEK